MTRQLSLYLDLVRFAAALLVFLDHASRKRLGGPLLGHLEWLAEFAVLVFFVLSGYVIAFAAECKDRTLGGYAAARIARIYSVALPALLLTAAADHIGMALKPALYAAWYQGDHLAWRLGASVLFLNELWWQGVRPLSDGPYWSIAYEVWYYAFFAAAFYLRGAWRFVLAGATLLVAGPKIVALLPVWLLGVGAYALGKRLRLGPLAGAALVLGSAAALLAFFALDGAKQLNGPGHHLAAWAFPGRDMRYSRDFLAAWLIGLMVAGNFLGMQALGAAGIGVVPAWAARAVRIAAGATFALYLFHNPLLHLYAAAIPASLTGAWLNLAVVALTLLTVFALAPFTEGKKEPIRRRLLAAFGRSRPAAA